MKHFVRPLCVFLTLSFVILAQEPNWNQFRGPKRDNHSFSTGIAKSWAEGGPKLLWKINTVGIGYANVSFFGDKIFTMGDFNNQCYVIALDRNTGKELWKASIGKGGDGGGGYPGPLGTPACDGENVYAISQFSDFAALDMKDGKKKWGINTQNNLGGKKMDPWGYAMSPIVDGDKILLPIGGNDGTLAAFDKSGKILWRTDWIKDPAAYTTPVPVEVGGIRHYMLLTGERLVGVSTEGKELWGTKFPGRIAVCSDPVLCGDVIMASSSYGVGAYFYRVTKEGENFKKVTSFSGPTQRLISHHGGIVAVGEHFYLLTERNLSCVEAKTGTIVWTDPSVGKGSLVYVDGKLILRSQDGPVAMVEAAPEGYKELGRFEQPDRSNRNSWTYPVVTDKKLYLRDQNVVLCYDLE